MSKFVDHILHKKVKWCVIKSQDLVSQFCPEFCQYFMISNQLCFSDVHVARVARVRSWQVSLLCQILSRQQFHDVLVEANEDSRTAVWCFYKPAIKNKLSHRDIC